MLDDAGTWRLVVESIGDGIAVADAAGDTVFLNRAAQRMLGVQFDARVHPQPREQLTVYRADRSTRVRPEEVPIVRAAMGEQIADEELYLQRPDHTGCFVSVTAHPLRAANGELRGAVAIFRDVTVHKAVSEDLARSKAFLNSIVENIPDMVFVKDAEQLRFELFNRAGEELLGMPRERMIGKNDHDFFPREQADSFQSADRETLRRGTVVVVDEEPITTPRGVRWLHTKKIPIVDERGAPAYLLGISRDITDKRRAEDELRNARDELELRVAQRTSELLHAHIATQREANERERAEVALSRTEEQLQHAQKMEAVGLLAGGVAHDFNNVLSVILSYAGMLTDDLPASDPMRLDLEQIRLSAERAAGLTQQLLAFSRKQVLQPQVLLLNDVVVRVETMLKRVIGENIELVTRLASDLGSVKADPGQVEQVIMNLVVNARDAMPNGGKLTIETTNLDVEPQYALEQLETVPGPHVLLAVSDTGEGMDRETRQRIFEPFFTTKAQGKGTGLGLSTCYGIVKQSGGSILVSSERGHGTTFKIYLPQVFAKPAENETPLSLTRPGRHETILLVEDEAPVRGAARGILLREGYRVIEAATGSDALRVCTEAGEIDLMITDVVMPGMSGRELATRLSTIRPTLRVLYMSGYTDNTLADHGVLDEGTEFLQKPFTPESLRAKVRAVLDSAAASSGLVATDKLDLVSPRN